VTYKNKASYDSTPPCIKNKHFSQRIRSAEARLSLYEFSATLTRMYTPIKSSAILTRMYTLWVFCHPNAHVHTQRVFRHPDAHVHTLWVFRHPNAHVHTLWVFRHPDAHVEALWVFHHPNAHVHTLWVSRHSNAHVQPKKLLGGGISTPCTPFCLTGTIKSELACFPICATIEWPYPLDSS